MAGPLFANNAVGTLAAAYGTTATALTLASGQGVKFPSPGPSEWFAVTVVDPSNNLEVMRCTARTGDTLTVARAQEGTPARNLALGEKMELRLTAAMLVALRDKTVDASQIAAGSITGGMIQDGSITQSDLAANSVGAPQIIDGSVGAAELGAGAAVGNLGFTPVRQGGGPGQSTNQINIGWDNAGSLLVSVDNIHQGAILPFINNGSVGSAGYRGLPMHDYNIDYVMAVTDNACMMRHYAGSNVWYLPGDAVPFGIGSVLQFVNYAGGLTIAVTGGATLRWLHNGALGNRVLTAPGLATAEKVNSNEWWIYGPGLS
jgi:hypothetical protein